MGNEKNKSLEMPSYLDDSFNRIFFYVQAKQNKNQSCPAHGFDHTLRVLKNQHEISSGLGLDEKLVYTSGLFHDIIRPPNRNGGNHAVLSANDARSILPSFGYDSSEIENIYQSIIEHNKYDVKSRTDLSRVLFEADKLDLFGIDGITRWLEFGKGDGLDKHETLRGALRIQIEFLKQYDFQYDSSRILLNEKAKVFFDEINKRIGSEIFLKDIDNHDGEYIVGRYIDLN